MLERETPVISGTWRELSLMNGTDSRNVSALTTLCQCAADAEPLLIQTLDTHVINQTYRQKYFQAGMSDIKQNANCALISLSPY